VQVIPHVTNEIKAAAKKVAQDVDVAIVEIGGTVATSNRCRLSKRSGRCGRNWAAITLCLCMSRWCRLLQPRRS